MRERAPVPRPHRHVVAVLVVAVAAIALLTGCGLRGDDEPEAKPSAGPDTGVFTAADSSTVQEAAVETLDVWSSPELSYARWWKPLQPLLSPGGQQAYAFSEPTAIPDLELSEGSKVEKGPNNHTATVYVETSAGRFGVDLARAGQGETWLAEHIIFPGQESMYR